MTTEQKETKTKEQHYVANRIGTGIRMEVERLSKIQQPKTPTRKHPVAQDYHIIYFSVGDHV
jgi:hypothetical protein